MSTLNQFLGIGDPLTITNLTSCIETIFDTTAPLGSRPQGAGGFLICKAASTAWIVSPRCAEVSRTWYLRNDSNTLANSCTSCTGWFIPTCEQLKNPGYLCREYWDFFSNFAYWSDTERNATCAWRVEFQVSPVREHDIKNCILCVRSFRCVTY
jgi:hypothetical protein